MGKRSVIIPNSYRSTFSNFLSLIGQRMEERMRVRDEVGFRDENILYLYLRDDGMHIRRVRIHVRNHHVRILIMDTFCSNFIHIKTIN